MDASDALVMLEAVRCMEACVLAILGLADPLEHGELSSALYAAGHQIEQMQSALEAL